MLPAARCPTWSPLASSECKPSLCRHAPPLLPPSHRPRCVPGAGRDIGFGVDLSLRLCTFGLLLGMHAFHTGIAHMCGSNPLTMDLKPPYPPTLSICFLTAPSHSGVEHTPSTPYRSPHRSPAPRIPATPPAYATGRTLCMSTPPIPPPTSAFS